MADLRAMLLNPEKFNFYRGHGVYTLNIDSQLAKGIEAEGRVSSNQSAIDSLISSGQLNFVLTDNQASEYVKSIAVTKSGYYSLEDPRLPSPLEFGKGEIIISGVRHWSNGFSYVVSSSAIKLLKSNKIAILGDSYDVRSKDGSNNLQAYGIWILTNALLGEALDLVEVDATNGSGALQLPTYSTRIDSVLAADSDAVAVRISINDISGGNSLQEIKDAYDLIFKAVTASGKTLIVCSPCAANTITTYDTPAKLTVWRELVNWSLNEVADTYAAIVLNNSFQTLANGVTGQVDFGKTDGGGDHPELNASFEMAQHNAKVLIDLVPTTDLMSKNLMVLADTVDAMLINPSNSGTSGTHHSTGNTSGVVADDLEAYVSAGTAICSKDPRGDALGDWQKFVWTPGSAGKLMQVAVPFASRFTALTSDISVGDTLRLYFEFKAYEETDGADIHYPLCVVEVMNGGTTLETKQAFVISSSFKALGKSDWEGVFRTVDIVIPPTCDGLKFMFQYYNKTANVQSVGFGRQRLVNFGQ